MYSNTYERPKNVNTTFTQNMHDDELFDQAKINKNTLDKVTEKQLVKLIIDLGELMSGFKCYPYQKDFGERIIWSLILNDGETIVGEFARQGGKSTTFEIIVPPICTILPLLAEYFVKLNIDSPIRKFINGMWVGVYGPDYDRAGIIGRKINSALTRETAKPILTSNSIGMEFPSRISNFLGKLPRNSFIDVKSANRKVSIEGKTYHLLITDETQEIDDYVLKKSMSPFLAATNGTKCHIGSAYPKKVYFYDVIQMTKQEDLNVTLKNKKNYFSADHEIVEKYNPNYKKYIDKEKRLLGETSDEFRMSYKLWWPISKGMFATEDYLINTLGKDYGVASYDHAEGKEHAIAIDLGKVLDSTVMTVAEVDRNNPIVIDEAEGIIRYNKKIKNWHELQGDDYDTQFHVLCNYLSNYIWKTLIIDASGVGQVMYDRFKAKYDHIPGKNVVPFVFSKDSKSEGYSLLRREILAGRWSIPCNERTKKLKKWQKFIKQTSNLEKKMNGSYMNVVSVLKNGHDDYPDSWMLVNWAIEGYSYVDTVEEYVDSSIYKTDSISGENNFLHN